MQVCNRSNSSVSDDRHNEMISGLLMLLIRAPPMRSKLRTLVAGAYSPSPLFANNDGVVVDFFIL